MSDGTRLEEARGAQAGVSGPAALGAALAVVLAYLAAALPLIATQHEQGRGRFDQVNYHEPAVLRFAEQLPAPDLSDYLSATTPGYHLVLAVVARAFGPDRVLLQASGALFSVALFGVLTWWLARRAGAIIGAALGLTLASSVYVLSAGIFILPDNAGWLGVLGVLLLSLRPRFDRVTLYAGGAVLLLLVLTRQSHLWAAAALWTAAWLGRDTTGPAHRGPLGEIGDLLSEPLRRGGRAAAMALATLPAFAAVGLFALEWGGLVPPIFGGYVGGANPATPGFVLVQIAIIGAFHVGFWGPPLWRIARAHWWLPAAAAGGGFALAVVPETTYDKGSGRWSGWWNVIEALPAVGGRTSLVFLLLAPAGALMLAGWLAGAGSRVRWVMFAALLGLTAATTVNHNAWQRYHEGFLLMLAAILSASCLPQERPTAEPEAGLGRGGRPAHGAGLRGRGISRAAAVARVLGPAALSVVFGLIAAKELREGRPAPILKEHPTIERPLCELWPEAWRESGPPAANQSGAGPDAPHGRDVRTGPD